MIFDMIYDSSVYFYDTGPHTWQFKRAPGDGCPGKPGEAADLGHYEKYQVRCLSLLILYINNSGGLFPSILPMKINTN